MKRITMSAICLLLDNLTSWAQAAAPGADAGVSSSGAMLGWSLTIIGVIVVLVVIARRLSTGEPWKQEVVIIIAGALLFNIGIWRIWWLKQDQLMGEIQTLKNRVTAEQRQISDLRSINDALAQKDAVWRMRDREWQQKVEEWQKYSADLKRRFEELTKPKTASKPAPAPKKGPAPKPASR